jgi:hypothetical protein
VRQPIGEVEQRTFHAVLQTLLGRTARGLPLRTHGFGLTPDGHPLAPQRIHQHRLDDQFDICCARVVQSELGALARIDRPLEQRPEDRRLDLAPIQARSGGQLLDLVSIERQDIVVRNLEGFEMRNKLAILQLITINRRTGTHSDAGGILRRRRESW